MKNPITPSGLFATPESMDALQRYTEGFSVPGERLVAVTVMGMTWNLASKTVDAALVADSPTPVTIPDDPVPWDFNLPGVQNFLDAMVHDTVSSMASEINNGGPEEQVKFLRSRGWTDEALRKTLEEAGGEYDSESE